MAQQEDEVTSTHCLHPLPHRCPKKGHFGSKGTHIVHVVLQGAGQDLSPCWQLLFQS